MRILLIEDEKDFRDSIGAAIMAVATGVEIIDIETFKSQEGEPAEDHFAKWIETIETKGPVDGALLDTDLSTNSEGLSQSLARQALHTLGIPTCRYSKKGKTTSSEQLRQLKLRMAEGAQAVPFPSNLSLAGDLEPSARWLQCLFESFKHLGTAITSLPQRDDGASGLLARALGEPDAEVDFATYREAYPYYFADLLDPSKAANAARRQHTQIGYWFVNCILAFPGPLLNLGATAAVLGLPDADLLLEKIVADFLNPCRYNGPFAALGPYVWRSKLLDRMDDPDAMATLKPLHDRLNIEPGKSLRYCLILDRPMQAGETPTRPDWIPAGAIESYVERKTYNQLNPWIQPPGSKGDRV